MHICIYRKKTICMYIYIAPQIGGGRTALWRGLEQEILEEHARGARIQLQDDRQDPVHGAPHPVGAVPCLRVQNLGFRFYGSGLRAWVRV